MNQNTVEILITHNAIQARNIMHYRKYARREISQGSEISGCCLPVQRQRTNVEPRIQPLLGAFF